MPTTTETAPRGAWFSGSQNAAHFCQPYDTVWLPQFFFSHLLERRVEWLDAGLFNRYCWTLVNHGHEATVEHPSGGFGTSWLEEALRCHVLVPCVRDECTLHDVATMLSDGTWGIGIPGDDVKRLGDRYDGVNGHICVGWNEGRDKPVIMGEALKARIIPLFESQATEAQRVGGSAWDYVCEVGRPVLYKALALTEEGGHRGLRVTDFARALDQYLFPGQPNGAAPSLIRQRYISFNSVSARFLRLR